jgi:hypothetical protein
MHICVFQICCGPSVLLLLLSISQGSMPNGLDGAAAVCSQNGTAQACEQLATLHVPIGGRPQLCPALSVASPPSNQLVQGHIQAGATDDCGVGNAILTEGSAIVEMLLESYFLQLDQTANKLEVLVSGLLVCLHKIVFTDCFQVALGVGR